MKYVKMGRRIAQSVSPPIQHPKKKKIGEKGSRLIYQVADFLVVCGVNNVLGTVGILVIIYRFT